MDVNTKKISIIVPVYNVESYLTDCLNTVINQNHENVEIILINDGSTDNSLSICRSFEKRDHRIIVIDNDNRGVSHARNSGLKIATGEYIAFVDADDKVDKNIYTVMLKDAVQHDSDLVICAYHKENFRGEWIVETCGDYFSLQGKKALCDFISKYYIKTTNEIWNKLYKRSLITTYFQEDIKTGEDLLFNIDYFQNCKNVSYLPKPMYYYRYGRKLSLTTRFDENRYRLNKMQNKELCAFVLRYQPDADLSGFHKEFLKKAFRYFQRVSCSEKLTRADKKARISDVCRDDYWKTVFDQIYRLSKMDQLLRFLILKNKPTLIMTLLKISTFIKYLLSK